MLRNVPHTRSHTEPLAVKAPRLYAEFIDDIDDIRQAQRLRYEVFCSEYNIELASQETWQGLPIDVEELDSYCRHLVVRVHPSAEIIGYTRVLTSELADSNGGYYSSQEFHISRLTQRSDRLLEIGRTCIHPNYRNGATIAILWAFLAKYMQQQDYRYLFGCASISVADGGAALATIMPTVRAKYMADAEFRVEPKLEFDLSPPINGNASPQIPPLLKAYLRIGARVCGEACWDPDFNVADLLVLLDLNNVAERYAKHFLKSRQAA